MALTTFKGKANNAKSLITDNPLAIGATTVHITAGTGVKFPATGSFYATLWDALTYPDPSDDPGMEYVLAVKDSTDTYTVSATTKIHALGAAFRLEIMKEHMDEYETAIHALEGGAFAGLTAAKGDILHRAAAGDGAFSPLNKGTAKQVLKVKADASDIEWADEYGAASIVIGEVPTGSLPGTVFTTAATFASGSLRVYKNGVRMKGGGVDYTEAAAGTGFTMVTSVPSGTNFLCDYFKTVDFAVVGTNSLIEDETATPQAGGNPDGAKVIYLTARAYIAGSLAVYLNGQKLTHTADFAETTPASGVFTFVTAPATGAVVRVGYQFNQNASGNADTVDGYHASSIFSGWYAVGDTWAYASADAPTFVVTVPTGAQSIYSIGKRVQLTQTTVKYFIITAVTDTTVTLYGGTDYTLTNAAISGVYISGMKAPLGFPMDPLKWSIEVTPAQTAQASPGAGTWYNISSITLPIGSWRVSYAGTLGGEYSSAVYFACYTTLSTANNSESDPDFTAELYLVTATEMSLMAAREKNLLIASKTVYYLNFKSAVATLSNLRIGRDSTRTIIRAVSNYL